RRFRRHVLAVTGAVVLRILVLGVLVGPYFWPVAITDIDFAAQLQGPSRAHPLGSDDLGPAVLARSLYGGRVSLRVGSAARRLVRAQFLSLREKEFVEAARALGASKVRQVVQHILPNALGPVIVVGTIDVAAAIIFESTLSFLGLGFPSDVPTWGSMLRDAKD